MTEPMTSGRPDNILRLSDGRMLGYAEYGAPAGAPVMFFHGQPGSRISAAIAHDAALARDVRIIAPDRPGFGLSSFQPRRRLLDWPADVRHLADALGIGRFAVGGVSGGGPYAAACAFAIPDRLSGAAIISGSAPLDAPGATDGMNRLNKIAMPATRRFAPFGRLLAAAMAWMATHNPERVVEMAESSMPEPDAAIVRRPEVRAIFKEDGAESFRQGGRGLAHDLRLVVRPWGFDLRDIRMRVHLWQGEADTNVPPSMGRYLASVIPDCVPHFYPGEGHLLVVDRIGEILDTIAPSPQPDRQPAASEPSNT